MDSLRASFNSHANSAAIDSKDDFQHTPPPRLKSLVLASFIAAAFFILIIALLFQYRNEHEKAHVQNNESLVYGELMALRSSVESALYQRLNLPIALKSFVVSNPEFSQEEFNIFATSLTNTIPGVMSLQLAPDAIVSYITNPDENKKALGHDLLGDPSRLPAVLRAIKENRFIVAGPIDLIQGGRAIIARLPIFLEGHEGRTEFPGFWGFSTILIDIEELFKSADVGEINTNTEIAIRGIDGLGAGGGVFFGDPQIFERALGTVEVSLPNGNWQIAGALDLDRATHEHPWLIIGGITLSLFLSASVWFLVYRQGSKELIRAKNEAERASALKSNFLAIMSHEMRTPLNGVLGVLDLLSQTKLDPRQSEYVEVATKSGEVLLRHINDVLDITRIEAGKIHFETSRLDIQALVQSVVEIARPAAESRGNRIECHAELPTRPVGGDAHRIRQVLLNFAGNATKFTRDGNIRIEARILNETDNGADVEFSVMDTGIGIDAEDLGNIFEDFVSLNSAYNRDFSGAGLGLSICRRVIHAMNGEIGVQSEPGEGSRFWIRLPLVAVQDDSKKSANIAAETDMQSASATRILQPSEGTGLSILLVEDNSTNRMIARDMLQFAGHAVTEACDGAEGVERARERAFDLILMDISMPTMDGVEATRQIRSSDGPCRDVPIVGLTAHAMADERQRFIDAGMQACLTKPLRLDFLLSALGYPEARADDTASSEKHKLVEDVIDTSILDEMADYLSREKFMQTILTICNEIESEIPKIASLALKDPAKVAHSAHKLAGSVAMSGGQRLAVLLRLTESAVKSGQLEAVAEMIEQLPKAAEQTCAALRKHCRDADLPPSP